MISRLFDYLAHSKGCVRALLLIALGAVGTLAFAPFYSLGAGAAAFSGFFLTVFSGKLQTKRAFKDGAFFGFGYFLAGLYWIPIALTTDIASFWWLIPVAAAGIPFLLCLYIGVACALAARLSLWIGAGFCLRLPIFILCWIGAEWLRSVMFTGFPWNAIGYSLAGWHTLLQSAALGGIWLLDLVALTLFLLPAAGVAVSVSRAPVLAGIVLIALMSAGLVAASQYGAERIAGYSPAFHDNVKIRIVQPNIPQTLKWDKDEGYAHLQLLAELSLTEDPGLKYVVWPEAAVPFMLTAETGVPEIMALSAPKNGILIAGAVRGERDASGNIEHVRNSIVASDRKGNVLAYYDKSHLVPFGEYVPLKRFFPFVEKITHGMADFTAGDGRVTMKIGDLPSFSPLVCYEAIFSGNVTAKDDKRPELLVNVTNDGWYGDTTGPHQHFAMAAVRAAEEGVPLIRAANNGISGVVDPLGRPMEQTQLNTRGVLDVKIPLALKEAPPFVRWRNGL